jgi:hypothetical protein
LSDIITRYGKSVHSQTNAKELNMPAGRYNIHIEQGATFRERMTYLVNSNPVDLSGYTARMKAKNSIKTQQILDCTTENGAITLGGSEGTIDLFINNTDTDRLNPDKYPYDLEISSGGEVIRLLQGDIIVSESVTK